ncbi:hypothetical protein CEUSTIGMA_g11771.t1 [Chlamydomonas eustigma]|uniref:DUF4079 domain-containing protein n=1 Tax=Chlamydomonas eustigma TaxID=1157962 RepID=A0A250XN28_9CHLO|nr:hypothetical protein CEUSTIGMA_g11771.t1 [Chlamydomonas eustigma]|eukprot:GAX84349.1 hypothetical protein CEUSTIGMA_g11771.t1 [Chlamydomonas eustigma]
MLNSKRQVVAQSRPTASLIKTPMSLRVSRSNSGNICCSSASKEKSTHNEARVATHLVVASSSLLSPLIFHAQSAMAASGEYGILEGRTVALIHPAVMFGLLASSLYSAYLGWQWRRTREIGEEIRELRKLQPAGAEGVAIENPELVAKEKERKELLAGKFKDKHEWMGALILASGTGIAIEGAVNTYIRTGKLFPGPHLFAGAGMVALWAFAAALVPEMQKGNNTARVAHIGLNSINTMLFLSQVPTGLEIVGKVFQFTQVRRIT